MDHGLWIDAIQQSPTAGYVDPFYLMAESMRVRESADLDNLSPADWPTRAVEKKVFRWLKRFCKRLDKFAHHSRLDIRHRRRLLGSRNVTVDEYSVLKQELNVGFVDASYPKRGLDDGNHPWSQILAPGRLKRKPGSRDRQRRRGLARSCGVCGENSARTNHQTFCRRVHDLRDFDEGRATTCWKAHVKDHPEMPLVIKDSWQLPERDEEGELLKQATSRNVVNVARYYLHETVKIGGIIDDVRQCIRRGLDVSTASNYQQCLSQDSSGATTNVLPQSMRLTSTGMRTKRSFDQTGSALPPSKKTCSESSRNAATDRETGPPNRVHQRVIVQDYGKPIYKASSRLALLACLEGCIKGHKSLYDNGVLHRDISITNLRINGDQDNPSWRSFLIDLDVAINAKREQPSGRRTGQVPTTTAFMAIGLLNGRKHSFAHDLESFFWVLFYMHPL
ncbi:hypothetical protein E4U52_007228 [Claviceps spartinae]|nr:hypothetical protein E4U52_007228 [Claviceps spartinae]